MSQLIINLDGITPEQVALYTRMLEAVHAPQQLSEAETVRMLAAKHENVVTPSIEATARSIPADFAGCVVSGGAVDAVQGAPGVRFTVVDLSAQAVAAMDETAGLRTEFGSAQADDCAANLCDPAGPHDPGCHLVTGASQSAAPFAPMPADATAPQTAPVDPSVFSAPVPAPPVPSAPSEDVPPAPADTTSPAAGVDLDAAGLPWDERIHSGSRAKVADGTWRQRRNLPDGVKEVVEAELRQRMGVAAPSAAPLSSSVSAAPATAPVPSPPATPISTQPPAAPVALHNTPGGQPPARDFVALCLKLTALTANGLMTEDECKQVVRDAAGVDSVAFLAPASPETIAKVDEAIERKFAG